MTTYRLEPHQAWNWLEDKGQDFASGKRDVTVLPGHIRHSETEYLEQVMTVYAMIEDDPDKMLSDPAFAYVMAARSELHRREQGLPAPKPKKLAKFRPAKKEKPERDPKAGYVYLLLSVTGHYKIGRTVNPENRLLTFGVLLPFDVEYICVKKTTDMIALERHFHQKFEDKRVRGEWFCLMPEDVQYIRDYVELIY